jgi:hypothetical protein
MHCGSVFHFEIKPSDLISSFYTYIHSINLTLDPVSVPTYILLLWLEIQFLYIQFINLTIDPVSEHTYILGMGSLKFVLNIFFLSVDLATYVCLHCCLCVEPTKNKATKMSSVLPDGIFSNQKIPLWVNLRGPWNEKGWYTHINANWNFWDNFAFLTDIW